MQIIVNQVINLDTPVLMIIASMNGICISWQPVDYAGEYQVYRAREPNGSYNLVATTGNTLYFDNNPQEKAFYYVKAVSYPDRESWLGVLRCGNAVYHASVSIASVKRESLTETIHLMSNEVDQTCHNCFVSSSLLWVDNQEYNR